MSFFQNNCKAFTDDEENRLEYTKIHEEYIYIIDEGIESKLRENHSQEAIDGFYDKFRDNFARYRKQNEISVDILFGALDFQKFKQSMLEFKNGMKDIENTTTNEGEFNLG